MYTNQFNMTISADKVAIKIPLVEIEQMALRIISSVDDSLQIQSVLAILDEKPSFYLNVSGVSGSTQQVLQEGFNYPLPVPFTQTIMKLIFDEDVKYHLDDDDRDIVVVTMPFDVYIRKVHGL